MAEYIERDAAKTAIDNCITEQTVSKFATSIECKAARYGATRALFALDDVQTADVVEVKHGEWKGSWDHECSVCGKTFEYKTPHCPYCGAKMKNGSEDLI